MRKFVNHFVFIKVSKSHYAKDETLLIRILCYIFLLIDKSACFLNSLLFIFDGYLAPEEDFNQLQPKVDHHKVAI